MSSEEEEYEIEYILEARVDRGPVWKFRVRWKGYSHEDDTWEPIEHLTGSEETLVHFLERINTGGRDHRNLTSFTVGERFLPIGPPKKPKGTMKVNLPTKDGRHSSKEITQESSRIRKREPAINIAGDSRSSKRPRSTLQTFNSKPNFLLTDPGSPTKAVLTDNPTFYLRAKQNSAPPVVANPPGLENIDNFLNSTDGNATPDRPTTVKNGMPLSGITMPPSIKPLKPTMPLHRARMASPLVKRLQGEDMRNPRTPEAKDNTARASQSLPRKSSKPGPGRSSDGLLIPPSTLLTAEKGKLKSIPGKGGLRRRSGRASNEEYEDSLGISVRGVTRGEMDVDVAPPKSEELLYLASLDPDSVDLPGFEDDLAPASNQVADKQVNLDLLSAVVRESLFPTAPRIESHPQWQRPTIFGPLGLGDDSSSPSRERHSDVSTMPLQLRLDSTTTLSILLDHVSTSTFPIPALSQRDPPGKFYHGSYAMDLLRTLRTIAPFAQACLSSEANEAQATNFKHFSKRLHDGQLFIAIVGQDLLAFCSSSNDLLLRRLNISGPVSENVVLAAHVAIENQSAFADAATNADNTIWSNYVFTAGAV